MTLFRPDGLLAAGLVVAVLVSGCETSKCADFEEEDGVCIRFESLKKYLAEPPIEKSVDWASGQNLRVSGVYGKIEVREGEPGVVKARFTPFDYRGVSKEDAARAEMAEHLLTDVSEQQNEILVNTGRTGKVVGLLGAEIEVLLPPEFDADLEVRNRSEGSWNPGSVTVDFVGQARSVSVATAALGDCTVVGAESVTYTSAQCDGKITVSRVANQVQISSTMLGSDVRVSLDRVDADTPESLIRTEDGNVELELPAAASFTVYATTSQGNVDPGALPDGCNVTESGDPRSKTISCRTTTPVYRIEAGTDGVGDSNITLYYW